MTQPATSNQATDLMGYLTKQREHVLGILENLPEEAMRRPVLPTGWTCAGLVQHLALDVERFWFRQVMTGEQVEPDEFGDDGWQVRPRPCWTCTGVRQSWQTRSSPPPRWKPRPPGGRTSSRPVSTWTTCGRSCCM